MKYSINTYRLYTDEKLFSTVVRIKVTMKQPVDPDVLSHAVNTAITRYPYYAVHVVLDEDGAYVLRPNKKKVVVLHASDHMPLLGSRRVNGHLLFVLYEGRDISFHISHAMCGGKGILPWVMTNIYQYVVEKYHIHPDAPGIRKPGEDLLPTETAEPSLDMLPDEEPVYTYQSKDPVVMIGDYMNGLYNPVRRKPNYRLFTFRQEDLVPFLKDTDASVISFFLVVMAKAMDRVLPEKIKVIGAETAHNPRESLGIPDSHCDFLSHVHVDYDREILQRDMEMLGTMTRGQIILQTDPSVSSGELRNVFTTYEGIDRIHGLKEKRKYMKEHDPSKGKDAKHGTFIVNYTGRMDWGEVADYVESYVAIVEGHLVGEVTSLDDKIFFTLMQLIDGKKYAEAFLEVLEELGIPCKVEGPFPKRLSKHVLPRA